MEATTKIAVATVISAMIGAAGTLGAAWFGVIGPSKQQLDQAPEFRDLVSQASKLSDELRSGRFLIEKQEQQLKELRKSLNDLSSRVEDSSTASLNRDYSENLSKQTDPSLTPPATIASPPLGLWEGILDQPNARPPAYPAKIILNQLKEGINAGTSEYETLGCGGELILRSMNGTTHIFRERLLYGRSNCVDGGLVHLQIVSKSSFRFQWFRSDSANHAEVSGTLTKSK